MGRRRDTRAKVELGDFQTPARLAAEVCAVLRARGLAPGSIVEPTCGTGSFLFAALDAFPTAAAAVAAEINDGYLDAVRIELGRRADQPPVALIPGSFFAIDWPAKLAALPEPLLVIGNPPWVTSADLGSLGSDNLPSKANGDGLAGLDAVTGKSNFDISEWMLGQLLGWLDGKRATLAMLCKTCVARKLLALAWRRGYRVESAALYRISAGEHFGAAVDAGLLVIELGERAGEPRCAIFDGLSAELPHAALGHGDGGLVADPARYERWKALGGESPYRWRSGIKHDCAELMELRATDRGLENGRGEPVALETAFLYPLLKSSDLAGGGALRTDRMLLVTQRALGDDTSRIAGTARRTWRYLRRHQARFSRRASSIYRGKPPFSIFGVGDYSFAPWKVAISGLYKRLAFRVVGPRDGKPVMFDDTCYFVACRSEPEAELVHALLSSEPATQFYSAFVFWDAKRPITIDLLRRLDLRKLADLLGMRGELDRLCSAR